MKKISIEQKKRWYGLIFLIPWLIGVVAFFAQPFINTIIFSMRDMIIKTETGGYELLFPEKGIFAYYIRAFTEDADFIPNFTKSLQRMLYEVPVIAVFALIIAIILNQEFKGRTFMRAIFFLPVIITSGIIILTMKTNLSGVAIGGESEAVSLFSSDGVYQFLLGAQFPEEIALFISKAISSIVDTVWRSGVQILLYMSALLAIPHSYYEVAQVEGATSWQCFWGVTFPLSLPTIMVNMIYTIVDSFNSYDNDVMRYINTITIKELNYSYASALYWIYFVVILVVIVFIYTVFTKASHNQG